jgi:hypothetical protein
MTAKAAAQPPAVEKPKHKIPELTTYELRDYRRALEKAIAFFGEQERVAPARADLQARLDAVIAEQDERARIARA